MKTGPLIVCIGLCFPSDLQLAVEVTYIKFYSKPLLYITEGFQHLGGGMLIVLVHNIKKPWDFSHFLIADLVNVFNAFV